MARSVSITALWAIAALQDEERNAYQVWKWLKDKGIELTPPGVNNVMRTLELEGLIENYKGYDTRETRIYRLTERGRMRAAVEAQNLRVLYDAISA